ncbi:MAG: ester cyclase [Pseudomonadota bacterium]
MNADEMKELVRHIMEDGFNQQDMAVVYESFHPDYVRHGFGVDSMGSLAEHVDDLKARHAAFENAHFVINKILAHDDTVAVMYTFKGIHRGPFKGLAPTGREVTRTSAAFFTVRDGKVAEGTIIADSGGMLAQLTGD